MNAHTLHFEYPFSTTGRAFRGGWLTCGPGLAEDDASGRSEDLADRLEAGGQARVLHNFPACGGVGIMARGTTLHAPELGIVTPTPRSRSARGRGGPKAATALMLLPYTGNLSGAY